MSDPVELQPKDFRLKQLDVAARFMATFDCNESRAQELAASLMHHCAISEAPVSTEQKTINQLRDEMRTLRECFTNLWVAAKKLLQRVGTSTDPITRLDLSYLEYRVGETDIDGNKRKTSAIAIPPKVG